MARTVYHVVHRNEDSRWHLNEVGSQSGSSFATKEEAVSAGEKLGQGHHGRGELAQVVIHRQDGSIEKEFTYGQDPRRTPG